MEFVEGTLKIRTATPGEQGLAIFMIEQEGLLFHSLAKVEETFSVFNDGLLVGCLQFYTGHAPPGTVGLAAIIFDTENRNKGIMQKAIALVEKNSTIHRLEACPATDNVSACLGLEKLGFVKEGVLKSWYPRGKGYVDAAVYAKVRE